MSYFPHVKLQPVYEWEGEEKVNKAHAIAEMLARSGTLFISGEGGPFFDKNGKEAQPASLWINCNDLFYWGCADAEPLPYDDIESAYMAWKEEPHGLDKWICKRRGKRPQAPVIALMKKKGVWDEEMEALLE